MPCGVKPPPCPPSDPFGVRSAQLGGITAVEVSTPLPKDAGQLTAHDWTERRERVLELGTALWVKLPLERDAAPDPDWDAYYRFVDEGGEPTLAEVRILPRTRTRAAERELHRALKRDGGGERVPVSPLTVEALRSVSPTDARHYLRVAAGPGEPGAGTLGLAGAAHPRDLRRRGKRGASRVFATGMRPDPDVHLAAFAQLYVDLIRRGSRSPVADIAAANPRWDRTYVRDQIFLAREKGFLTPERYGSVHGELTLKARRVLHGADRSAEPHRRG
jgi:hypothetical protein